MNLNEMSINNRSVNSFLNTTFQSSKDLDNEKLKELLAKKRHHQNQLDQEFEIKKESTQKVLSTILSKANSQRIQLGELHSELAETKDQLRMLHTQLTGAGNDKPSAILLQQLAAVEQKITRLNKAKMCIKTLLVASDLRKQAMIHMEEDPEKAIKPYQQLVKFARLFESQCSGSDDLVQYLHKRVLSLHQDMGDVLSKNFKACLEELGWPVPIKPPYGLEVRAKLAKFEKQFRNLALLKCPDPEYRGTPAPIVIMLEAINLRFRFHFESSKPTNRLDKPEWYLTHVKTTISTHIPFLVTTIQPLIVDTIGSEYSAKDLFITEFLKNVSRKLKHSIPKLRSRPRWLSHAIHEALDFDKVLQEDYAYNGSSIASIILDDRDSYNAWFIAEKKFAQARYDEIAMDSYAYEPIEEVDEQQQKGYNNIGSKPTRIAVKLINLFNSVTETYKLISRLEQKLDFFLEIQLPLLNQFQNRLTSALDSFEALNLIRTVPVPGTLPDAVTGVTSSSDHGGSLAALKKLCRWWASARTISNAIDEYAVDDHFLELQYQIRNNMETLETAITSKKEKDPRLAFLCIPEPYDKTFLAATKDGFEQFNKQAEEIMIRVMMKEWASDARNYVISWQLNKQDDNEEGQEELSTELYQPLQTIRLCCNYLVSNLPQADFVSMYRRLSGEIEEWHMRNVVAPNRLDTRELKRLNRDLKAGLWKLGRLWVSKPENYMRKLKATAEPVDESSLL